jgi:tetratricopeptide (TPR) repeat protein
MGSLALRPDDNAAALIGLSSLASARHDFSTALEYGERARSINPYDGAVHGVIGDALVELGRYREALDAYQLMVDTEPGFAAYARVSYARELRGDIAGAERAMTAALETAGTPGDTAFAAFQLGELAWNTGRPVQAGRWYRRASAADPAWVPPLAGLARVRWARGDLEGAIERFEEVVTRYPSPEYVVWLGDLLTLAGREGEAAAQFDLARVEADLFRANGVNVDLELALFEADHGEAAAAVEAASAEWDRRRSIHVADAYAWALHAAGEDDRAIRYSRRALSLGTRNSLSLYHAGAIELALGHRAAAERLLAQALDTNPWFAPLGAAESRATLERIS